MLGAAALTWWADSLVWLNITAQVANAMLLPVLAGIVIVLAVTAPSASDRLRGWCLWLVAGVSDGVAGAW